MVLQTLSVAKGFINLEKYSNNISPENILIAKGCVYGCLGKKLKTNFPDRFVRALRSLKKNENIYITKADKSNTFVILDKNDYLAKLNELLSDETTYLELPSDPTTKVNASFNKKLKTLLKGKQELVKKISCVNPSLPYMYGVIKTHKQGNPARPIISSVGSVSYLLSKWLTSVLSVIVGTISDSHVKNTLDLVTKLKSQSCECTLVSFDVNSLFTKVPVQDLLEFLKHRLQDFDLPVNLSSFLKLIELCSR